MTSETTEGQASPRLAGRAHIPALDGFRGMAILLVLVYHLLPENSGAWYPYRIFFAVTRYGSYGVDLFFVLSGFLISGILIDTRNDEQRFKKFYARRALRIFPIYFGVLIVLFGIVAPLGGFNTPDLQRIVHHQYWLWIYSANIPISFTNTWYFNSGWLNVSHLWSLAVEEHFYLAWPLVIFCFRKRTAIAVCAALIVISCICRSAFMLHGLYLGTWTFTFSRCDELAMGAAAAILARSPARRHLTGKRIAVFAAASLVLVLILGSWRPHSEYLVMAIQNARYLAMGLFSAGCVLSAALFPASFVALVFNTSALKVLGKYSYGLYVYHVILLWFCSHYIGEDFIFRYVHSPTAASLLLLLGSSAVSFIAAYLSWHLYEKHFLKFKKYFEYRKAPPMVSEVRTG